jgi:two-component system, OmpR family, response regulator
VAELVARVKAIFRRIDALSCTSRDLQSVISIDGIVVDPIKREVTVRRKPVGLTSKEFDLLLHLMRNPGRAYSRAQLLDMVWGYSHEGYEHAINCHINRLRAKIEDNHANPQHLLTVWGVGYKFSAGATAREG